MPDTALALTEKFASQELVDRYVALLGDDLLVQLTDYCGSWRDNDIENALSPNQAVEWVSIPVADILLSRAEGCLIPAFERNAWRLTEIASDAEVLSSCPYRHHKSGEPVLFDWCLARREGTLWKIFDGMHRAIQLVRNGEECIPLCVVCDPDEPTEHESEHVG